MRARQLIDGASFGPEALRAIGEAFDTAWADIAGNFGDDPTEPECARLKLRQRNPVDRQWLRRTNPAPWAE